ncbi:MAG: hypothetical protein OEZ34_04225 [Spirochaetia bacterium]|nr:hypothetical protein [Spirochaetia bacterium]
MKAYSFGILLDGEDHACSGINELTLTYNRLRDEGVDDDDEDYDNDEFEMVDYIDDQISELFIKSAEIHSIENPNFWDDDPPEDAYKDKSIMHLCPTAVLKVYFQDPKWISKFMDRKWETYHTLNF